MALNSEQAMPELKKHVSGEEQKLEVALKSKLIRDSSLEEIKETLRFIMVKIGLRAQNWPNDLEKVILHQHIVENFSGNNLEEIKLAFEMAIAGKLDLEDVKCYENFSCMYFSMIMNAYRKWSAQAYEQVKIKIEEPPKQRIFTKEELEDGEREDVERQYSLFLKGYPLKGLEFNRSILEKDGLIKDKENIIDFFGRRLNSGIQNIYIKKNV